MGDSYKKHSRNSLSASWIHLFMILILYGRIMLRVYVRVDVGVLPTDVAEMTMDVDDYAACDADTARDRDPIVRVSDPEYYGSSGQSKLMACCCVTPRTACQRRLFILTGLTALLTAAALLAILVYLILTRP